MAKELSYKERLKLPIGSRDYRAFVGPLENQDIYAALQFNLLTTLGLREFHYLLDVGCGSLRGGKLFIPYLLPKRYYGIEPEKWLIEQGIEEELGQDIIKIKKPQFSTNKNFELSIFRKKFDFILAQSVFSHASGEQITKCFREAKKVMKKNSIFIANYLKGAKNYKGQKWVYPDCVTYKEDFFITLAQDSGLVYQEIDWPHPNQLTWFLLKDKGSRTELSDLNNSAKVLRLQNQLLYTQERLSSIQRHPYVRLGLTINKLYQFFRRIFTNTRFK